MCKFVLFVCILIPAISYSQATGAKYMGADGIQHDYQILDASGQPIPIGDHSNISGNPFMQDKWAFGFIKLTNGNSLSDSSVNYSLYNNKLYFKRAGNIYQVNGSVKEFSIKDLQDSGKEKYHHFINGFPPISRNDTSTFYEVLFAGDSLALLKWVRKKIIENYTYNGAFESAYASVQEFFIYYPKENKIVSLGIKVNLNVLKKYLPQYSTQIEAYTSLNKLNTKKDDDLIQMFSFLDAAKH